MGTKTVYPLKMYSKATDVCNEGQLNLIFVANVGWSETKETLLHLQSYLSLRTSTRGFLLQKTCNA